MLSSIPRELSERNRPYYARFSPEEYARRYDAVRQAMVQASLDGLIVYGALGIGHGANVRYLSNYADFRNSYIMFPLEGPLTQFMGLYCHAMNARAISVVEDVRWSGKNIAASAAQRAKEMGFAGKRIGLVGVAKHFQSVPHDHFTVIQELLPGTDFINATEMLEQIRMVPSEEEIERLKLGAYLSDLAMDTLVQKARPGISERQLVAEVECVTAQREGEVHVFLLGATPMHDPAMPYPWHYPSSRVIQNGDIILTEISIDPWRSGYCGQVIRPIALGDPPEEYWKLYRIAREVYSGVKSLLKTGNKASCLHEVTTKIYEAGYTIEAPVVHGMTQTIVPPLVGIPQIEDWNSGLDTVMKANQTIQVEPNPCTRDLKMGIFLGDMCRVTSEGGISYQNYPMEFIIK